MNSHLNDIEKFSPGLSPASASCIWVPSDRLVLHHVPVPSAPKRKWAELVPWMLEDKLLQSPKELHFVIAGKNQNLLSVLVCDKNQMKQWIKTVEDSGLSNYLLIPDYMALPWREGLICVASYADKILLRSGEVDGFAAKPELAWHMLTELLQGSEQPLKVLTNMPEDEVPETVKNKAGIEHLTLDWQTMSFPAKANLLQGEFTQAAASGTVIPWLKTAALLVLTLALSFTALAIDNSRLEEEIAYLNEQNRSSFYSLFPGLTIRSGDIRATLESFISDRFKQRESLQSEAMLVLTELDRFMSACNCDLQSLNWRNNTLELILPQNAEAMVEQWRIEGYQKQIHSNAEDTLSFTLNREYE